MSIMAQLSMDGPNVRFGGEVPAVLAVVALARTQTGRSYGVIKKWSTNTVWSS